jgi:hypothetical protein
MSNRLNQDREEKLNPKRMQYAKDQLIRRNVPIVGYDKYSIQFQYKGELCRVYPYTGWHTGKTIKDGRGIENLLKQLK